MKEIIFKLKEDFIPLIQLLKYTGIADSGAHASELVVTRQVVCNGEIELRKRYKVVIGDIIVTGQTRLSVIDAYS